MEWVSGVDGCKGGWLVVDLGYRHHQIEACDIYVLADDELDQLLSRERVAIDIPIGLFDQWEPGGRPPDRAARKYLGAKRSSIFSPPYRDILDLSPQQRPIPKGMTLQGMHITPKIAAIDAWITPQRQEIVIESHPECVFARLLGGEPIMANKKSLAGREARIAVLEKCLPQCREWLQCRPPTRLAAMDDVIDAMVLAYLAHEHLQGRARRLPQTQVKDSRDLDMAIWY